MSFYTESVISWLGHVARMPFVRVPRKLLSLWVKYRRPKGAPEFTYGRGIYKALRRASISKDDWFVLAQDRCEWRRKMNSFD